MEPPVGRHLAAFNYTFSILNGSSTNGTRPLSHS